METFRIEDRAAEAWDAGFRQSINGISLFEFFRPPHPALFLNHLGTVLAIIALFATLIAAICLRPWHRTRPVDLLIVVALCVLPAGILIFPAGLTGFLGVFALGALATKGSKLT